VLGFFVVLDLGFLVLDIYRIDIAQAFTGMGDCILSGIFPAFLRFGEYFDNFQRDFSYI